MSGNDAWSKLSGASGDAWNRLYGNVGDAWSRLPGSIGDAWPRFIFRISGISKYQIALKHRPPLTGRKARLKIESWKRHERKGLK